MKKTKTLRKIGLNYLKNIFQLDQLD